MVRPWFSLFAPPVRDGDQVPREKGRELDLMVLLLLFASCWDEQHCCL